MGYIHAFGKLYCTQKGSDLGVDPDQGWAPVGHAKLMLHCDRALECTILLSCRLGDKTEMVPVAVLHLAAAHPDGRYMPLQKRLCFQFQQSSGVRLGSSHWGPERTGVDSPGELYVP